MSSAELLANSCLGPRPCFTYLDALVPRVIKFSVSYTSAVSEPRATATATTAFARFPDGAAFGTQGTDGRRRDCGCVCVVIGERHNATPVTA